MVYVWIITIEQYSTTSIVEDTHHDWNRNDNHDDADEGEQQNALRKKAEGGPARAESGDKIILD